MIITPDITADTCDGATGWARGSQMWNGMAPALVANPMKAKSMIPSRVSQGIEGAAACQAWKSRLPPEFEARIANEIRIAAVATCVTAR